MRDFFKNTLLFLALSGLAVPCRSEPTNHRIPEYSILGGALGGLAGFTAGGFIGAGIGSKVAGCEEDRGPSMPDADDDFDGLGCGLGVVYGFGIGSGIGYTLGIPIGAYFGKDLATKPFAANLAANALLAGALAYANYKLFEWKDEKSFGIIIPLDLLMPPALSYWMGKHAL